MVESLLQPSNCVWKPFTLQQPLYIFVLLKLLLSTTLCRSFLISKIFRCFSGLMHIAISTAAVATHFPLEKELDNMQKSTKRVPSSHLPTLTVIRAVLEEVYSLFQQGPG